MINYNKYHAHKCVYKNEKFDSKREMERYIVLLDREKKGLISDLKRQVKFILFPDEYVEETVHLKTKDKTVKKRTHIGVYYVADFVYRKKNGVQVVEDVKISPKMIPKEYILKEKMMYYLRGIDIKRIYKPNAL